MIEELKTKITIAPQGEAEREIFTDRITKMQKYLEERAACDEAYNKDLDELFEYHHKHFPTDKKAEFRSRISHIIAQLQDGKSQKQLEEAEEVLAEIEILKLK